MKKEYSLIDLRLIELRRFYLFKIFVTLFLVTFFFTSLLVFIFLPLNYEVPYKDFVYSNASFFYNNEYRILISIIITIILCLVDILLAILLISFNNRKYVKMYESIMFNELALDDMNISLERNMHYKKIISEYLNEINSNYVDSEYLFNVSHQKKLSFFNLRNKNTNKATTLLVLHKLPSSINGFIQVTDIEYLKKHHYKDEQILEYHYTSKIFNKYKINSTLGKTTNYLCEGGLIKLVDEIRKYCKCNVSFIVIDEMIYIHFSNFKFKLYERLFKKIKASNLEKKVIEFSKLIFKIENAIEYIKLYKEEK